jgi:hypothetical protein
VQRQRQRQSGADEHAGRDAAAAEQVAIPFEAATSDDNEELSAEAAAVIEYHANRLREEAAQQAAERDALERRYEAQHAALDDQ